MIHFHTEHQSNKGRPLFALFAFTLIICDRSGWIDIRIETSIDKVDSVSIISSLSNIIYNIYKLLIKRSLLLLSFHFLLFFPSFSKIGKDEETRFRFRLCTFSRSRRFLSSSRFIGFWRRRWFVDLWRRGAWLFGKVWIQLPFRTIYMDLYPYNAPIIFTSACLFIVGNFGNGG